jgi:anti-sigma-K factor RskA
MTAPDPDREMLAAEWALGLLEGDELAAARDLLRTDPAFAAEVAAWNRKLVPLLQDVEPVAPPADSWSRIAGRLPRVSSANDNDRALERRLSFWRAWSVAATAAAAAFGLLLLVDQRTTPPVASPPQQQAAGEAMLATMAAEGSAARLVASWEPTSRGLTVAAVAGVAPVAGHSHELWVIPEGGSPRSLGVMPSSGRMHAQLSPAEAAAFRRGVTLALSVEPTGGSPSGQPTGPVIAAGQLLPA